MNFWKKYKIVGIVLLLTTLAVVYFISGGNQSSRNSTPSEPQGQGGLRLN